MAAICLLSLFSLMATTSKVYCSLTRLTHKTAEWRFKKKCWCTFKYTFFTLWKTENWNLMHIYYFLVLSFSFPLTSTRVTETFSWMKSRQPASLWTVLHVMSNLAADPAASVIRSQLAVCQHLRVKEVVLQQNTTEMEANLDTFLGGHSRQHSNLLTCLVEPWVTYHFGAGDGVERSSKQLSPVNKRLHDEVCH